MGAEGAERIGEWDPEQAAEPLDDEVEPLPKPEPPVLDPERQEAYAADRPKTLVELQRYRTEIHGAISDGERAGMARLSDLAPAVGRSLLLQLRWEDGAHAAYHLERRVPRDALEIQAEGLRIDGPGGELSCALWVGEPSPLEAAVASEQPHSPLCAGRLTLRNLTDGRRSEIEWTTDLLRDYVPGGERITTFVRDRFFKDRYIQRGRTERDAGSAPEALDAPPPPALAPEFRSHTVQTTDLGIALEESEGDKLRIGAWYQVRGRPGIFLGALQPSHVDPALRERLQPKLATLDSVEEEALVFAVAFDLSAWDLDYLLGTDHPRLGWSERAPEWAVDDSLPGPDGVGRSDPLVRAGRVDPAVADDVAAVFTGGFKRSHGAFKVGELASRNHASHYGFIEQGVVWSKLQPGLATLLRWTDGRIEQLTWSEADDARSWRIAHARQNGVPILAPNAEGEVQVSPLIRQWAAGNWGGSVDARLRSLRASTCTISTEDRDYLLYGYFSAATPSAMALVLSAYGCDYAMLMDMNALEHTYMAVVDRNSQGEWQVQHLHTGMAVLDREVEGRLAPRFLEFSDNRDFYYAIPRSR